MDIQYGIEEGMRKSQWEGETDYDIDEWQRWDEELVERFGRWLSRLGKALAIMLLAVVSAVVVGWL